MSTPGCAAYWQSPMCRLPLSPLPAYPCVICGLEAEDGSVCEACKAASQRKEGGKP